MKKDNKEMLTHGVWEMIEPSKKMASTEHGEMPTWRVKCVCGKELYIPLNYILDDKILDCGCGISKTEEEKELPINRFLLKSESGKELLKTTHNSDNVHYKRAYSIFVNCNYEDAPRYKKYHKKGIKCLLGDTLDEVIDTIESIPGYVPGARLMRIDTDCNYELDNLKWVISKKIPKKKIVNKTPMNKIKFKKGGE